MQFKAVIAPMLIAAVGIVLSIIGIFSVRTKEDASMRDLLNALGFGTNLSSALIVVATFLILWLLGINNWINLSLAVISYHEKYTRKVKSCCETCFPGILFMFVRTDSRKRLSPP